MCLDDTLESLKLPTLRGSWVSKMDRRALRALGVYVPPIDKGLLYKDFDDPLAPAIRASLPALACIYFTHSASSSEKRIFPRFCFAIKQPNLPIGVQQLRGTAYQFGMSLFIPEGKHDPWGKRMHGFWWYAWAVVQADGNVAFARELRATTTTLRSNTQKQSVTIPRRGWQHPGLVLASSEAQTGELPERVAQATQMLAGLFKGTLTLWAQRAEHWSVAVHKDEQRAMFGVAKEQTAAYFADRDLEIACDGRRKKIIHYVREHTRRNGSTVRAHVRGVSNFDWNGYQVTVTAPNLNGILASLCPITPELVDGDDEDPVPPGWLTTADMANLLAQKEDSHNPTQH